jgi:Ca2+-transporting ATPase
MEHVNLEKSNFEWHRLSRTETVEQLKTDLKEGLTQSAAAERLDIFGANLLQSEIQVSLFKAFLGQLKDPLIYVLLAAVVITLFMGAYVDAIIILTVVLLNALLGLVQERRAGNALAALQQMAAPKALVRREGVVIEINAATLVPGDIVLLDAGRVVPADLRLLVTSNVKIDESALTGESVAVDKSAKQALDKPDIAIGDRSNMAFSSTLLTYGRAEGVVVATGQNTEVGKIAHLLKKEEKVVTPLEQKLAALGKTLGKIAVLICVLMFFIGWIQGRDFTTMFITAVSLAVASIPEGLAAIVAIVLSVGVTKMAKRNAIVKKLPAVETLGAVNIVCTDKTGTLTQNKMQVSQLYTFTEQLIDTVQSNYGNGSKFLSTAMFLSSDATLEGDKATGDPTEIALLYLADSMQLNRKELQIQFPRIDELSFDSKRKMMSTLHKAGKGYHVYTKGAIDHLLLKCTSILEGDEIIPLTDTHAAIIDNIVAQMSEQALRTLAVAYKPLDSIIPADQFEQDLVLIGLVGMKDPPRPEAKIAIAAAKKAGIKTVMITGDHKDTAFAIAKELAIASHKDQVISGNEIDSLGEEAFAQKAAQYSVFARVSPEHKVKIVKALKAAGNVVSMTGDGVNDAPSLSAADIGVAMGISGTDVAKNASSMILADDNFSTIIAAIEQGRNIYNNIKKSVVFLLSSNVGEVIAMMLAVIIGAPLPLLATQLLWINLVTDSLPAIALGIDPGSKEVMQKSPRPSTEGFFTRDARGSVWIGGLSIGLVTLLSFYMSFQHFGVSVFDKNLPENVLAYSRTTAFMTIIVAQLFFALTFGSKPTDSSNFFVHNKYLIGAIALGLLLQIMVIETPLLANAFHLRPLVLDTWLQVLLLGSTPMLLHGIYKKVCCK